MEQETAIATVPKVETVHLVARDPQQMAAAQSDLTSWLERKVVSVKAELAELETARDYAKAHKWNYKTLASQASKTNHLVTYYDKMLEAVKAGFTLVPNFPIDLFAIRIWRDLPNAPMAHDSATAVSWEPRAPTPVDETAEAQPAGIGDYVSPAGGKIRTTRWETQNDKGQIVKHVRASREEFGEVAFPLIAARPVVMQAAQEAMALRIFDEVGICPPRQRKGDPLIIGRINLGINRYGLPAKQVSFLIAWHLNLNDL